MAESNRKQLPAKVEEKLVADVESAFAKETEGFRAAAVVWGRKQLKHERGLRSSTPPVPPGLQGQSRDATKATIARVAKAIGAKIEESTPASDLQTTAVEAAAKSRPAAPAKPDPKPSSKKSTRSSARSAVKT